MLILSLKNMYFDTAHTSDLPCMKLNSLLEHKYARLRWRCSPKMEHIETGWNRMTVTASLLIMDSSGFEVVK